MKPILFEKNATDFTTLGICRLPDAISCTVTEERNGLYEMELVYPASGINFSEITEDRILVARAQDEGSKQAFRIYRHETLIDGEVTFYARHISYQLNYIPIPAADGTAASADAMMASLAASALEDCPFTFVSDIIPDNPVRYSIAAPASLRSALGGMEGSVLDRFGGEFEWDNWTVRLHRSRGVDNGVRITYGKNIVDLSRTVDIGSTITGVMAYYQGTDEEENTVTVYSSPRVISNGNEARYAHPHTAILDVSGEFESTPTEAQVTAYARNYLAAATLADPTVALTVDFVPLWQTDEADPLSSLARVHLCDTVYVGYKQLGIEVTKKVTKTIWNVLLDRYDSIELGGESDLADTILSMEDDDESIGMKTVRLFSMVNSAQTSADAAKTAADGAKARADSAYTLANTANTTTMNNFLSTTTVSKSSVVVNAGSAANCDIAISRSGYTPVAVAGYRLSSTNCSYCNVYACYLSSTTNVRLTIRNLHSSNATNVTAQVIILWRKNM